jgi:hypothetical protein
MKYGTMAAIAVAAIALASAVVMIDYDDGSDESAADDWVTDSTYTYLEYRIIDSENHYVEVRWNGDFGFASLTIPASFSIDGLDYTVTRLADNAFEGLDISSYNIELPSTLQSIGDYAFKDASWNKMFISGTRPITVTGTELTMTGLTSIGEGAFYGCTNLEHIEISASVTSVGGGHLQRMHQPHS